MTVIENQSTFYIANLTGTRHWPIRLVAILLFVVDLLGLAVLTEPFIFPEFGTASATFIAIAELRALMPAELI